MRGGIPRIALWLGMLIGGMASPVATRARLPGTIAPPGCPGCAPQPWWQAWLMPWSLGAAALLLLLIVVTAAILRRRRRARWLARLTVTGSAGAEASMATGPIALAGPVLTLDIRCTPGKAGPLGAVPILGVDYDD